MKQLVTAFVLWCTACGGSGSVAFTDFTAQGTDALCSYLVKCGQVEDMDTCRATNLGNDMHVSASLAAGVMMGTIVFDGGDAQACFDAIGSRSCDFTSESNRVFPAACQTIFTGTVHAAGTCALDEECISQVCNVPSCDQACCTGSCEGDALPVLAKAGESCETADCDAASYCDEIATTCVALKLAADLCLASEQCNYGLDCLPDGTCGSLPALGDTCTGACRDDGTRCSSATHVCVKRGLVGDACQLNGDCSQLYTCDASKHCAAGLPLGAECLASQRCADPGAFCDVAPLASSGNCVLPKADGSPCRADSDCQSDVCDQATEACIADTVCL